MKLYAGLLIVSVFPLCGFPGCERTERAVDLYKKAQDENRQMEEGKQIEPQRRAIENRIKDAYNAKDREYGEKEEAVEIK